jgi:hypothetical protein
MIPKLRAGLRSKSERLYTRVSAERIMRMEHGCPVEDGCWVLLVGVSREARLQFGMEECKAGHSAVINVVYFLLPHVSYVS